eukprot:754877-Amorphochlora_amoeboformis.AAC.1
MPIFDFWIVGDQDGLGGCFFFAAHVSGEIVDYWAHSTVCAVVCYTPVRWQPEDGGTLHRPGQTVRPYSCAGLMAGRSSCLRDFGGEGSKTWEIRALFWVLIYCLLCLQTGSRVGARCPLSSAQRIRKSISGSGSRAVGGTDKMVGTPPDGVVWVSRAVGTRRGGVLGRIREARRALGFGLRGGRGTFDAAGTDPATPVMDASAVASSSEGGEAYRRVDAGGALGYHTSSRRQSRRPSRTTLASISSRASRASQFSPSPQKIHNPHLTPVNQGSGQDDPTPPEFSKKYPSKPSPSPSSTGVRSNEHVVIIGGGLAGLSVALHLLKMDPAINLQIWDENP